MWAQLHAVGDQKHLVVSTKIKQQKPREVPIQGPCVHRKHLESKKYGDLRTRKRKGGRDRFTGLTSSTCSRWKVLRLLAGRRWAWPDWCFTSGCHGEKAHAGVRVRGPQRAYAGVRVRRRCVRSLCIAHTRDVGTESQGSAVEEGWEVEEAVYLERANGTTCWWAEFWTEGREELGTDLWILVWTTTKGRNLE